jgi:hypothetical protein
VDEQPIERQSKNWVAVIPVTITISADHALAESQVRCIVTAWVATLPDKNHMDNVQVLVETPVGFKIGPF